MKARTEELLYMLLWTYELFGRPSYRDLNQSFESWAYRRGILRQIRELERRKLIEAEYGPDHAQLSKLHLQRAIRLTEAGRIHALGGRDPEICWSRPWDGRWRMVIFDIPQGKSTTRDQIRRCLKRNGFGWLQNSVWISPHPLDAEKLAGSAAVDASALVFIEGCPCAGETDKDIVRAAWSFWQINQLYSKYRYILKQKPSGPIHSESEAEAMRRWAARERESWLEAVSADPLLPKPLWPEGYTGLKTWHLRKRALRQAATQARSFTTD